ncbi:MAG: homoserine kinase [Chloroflexi bacterium]|nr:homoserine kinase [Chloroflexota bacterium]
MPSRVRVLVPASTANLGPGFDCLGLALSLYNTVEMTALGPAEGLQVEIKGEGADRLSPDENNLIVRAANAVWEKIGHGPVGVTIKAHNGIPLGSGMGSSAAAVVAGLAAANALTGGPLSRSDLLRLAYQLEGHPDNAAAALFGGLTMVSATGDELLHATLEVPPLKVAIALPSVRLSTIEAREALPKNVPLKDAVFNIGRAAFVVRALQSGDYEMLGFAMTDKLHQPYRRKLIPGFDAAVQAARTAGASAVALSGAGPSLAAFAPDHHWEIANAMKAAFESSGVTCRAFVLPVDRQGVQISVVG